VLRRSTQSKSEEVFHVENIFEFPTLNSILIKGAPNFRNHDCRKQHFSYKGLRQGAILLEGSSFLGTHIGSVMCTNRLSLRYTN